MPVADEGDPVGAIRKIPEPLAQFVLLADAHEFT